MLRPPPRRSPGRGANLSVAPEKPLQGLPSIRSGGVLPPEVTTCPSSPGPPHGSEFPHARHPPRRQAARRGAAAANRIGVLGTAGSGAQELEHALRELGWVDGRNVIIERRLAPSYDGLARHARELAQLPVDVMVCTNAPAVRAAKSATQTIPIVMAPAGDPIAAGFVSNLARPGGTSQASPSCTRNLAESGSNFC